jgi:hypothetical protein
VTRKKAAQLDREIAAALAGQKTGPSNDGGFYLTGTHEGRLTGMRRRLGPGFPTLKAAKHAALKLVCKGVRPRIMVWHQRPHDVFDDPSFHGSASKDGWSDV